MLASLAAPLGAAAKPQCLSPAKGVGQHYHQASSVLAARQAWSKSVRSRLYSDWSCAQKQRVKCAYATKQKTKGPKEWRCVVQALPCLCRS